MEISILKQSALHAIMVSVKRPFCLYIWFCNICFMLPSFLERFPPRTVTEADLSRRGGRGGRGGRGRGSFGDFHPRPQLGFTPNSGYRGRGSFSTAPAARMIRYVLVNSCQSKSMLPMLCLIDTLFLQVTILSLWAKLCPPCEHWRSVLRLYLVCDQTIYSSVTHNHKVAN